MIDGENGLRALVVENGGKVGDYVSPIAGHWSRMATDVIRATGGKAGKRVSLVAPGERLNNWYATRRGWLNDLPDSTIMANRAAKDSELVGRQLAADGTISNLKSAKHRPLLIGALKELGVVVDPKAPIRELQAKLLEARYIRPTLADAVTSGKITQEQSDAMLLKLKSPLVTEKTGPGAATVTGPLDRAPLPSEVAKDALGAIPIDTEAAAKLGRVTSGKMAATGMDTIMRGLARLPKETLTTGVFDKNAVSEFGNYMRHGIENFYLLRTTRNFLKQPGVIGPAGEKGLSLDAPKLLDVWKKTGMSNDGLRMVIADNFGAKAATNAKQYARNLHIHPDAVRTLDLYRHLRQPGAEGKLTQAWDKAMSVYKSWWTIPRVAFHGRNEISGFANSAAEGLVSPAALAKEYANAHRHAATGKGLAYVEEFVGLGGLKGGQLIDATGAAKALEEVPKGVFGGAVSQLGQAVRHPVKSLRFWDTNLITPDAVNPILEAGNKLYGLVEFVNRSAYYEAMRKAGYAPAQAMHYVERAQFNYAKNSPFINKLAHIVPFVRWTANNVPLQISRLAQRPLGGMTGIQVQAFSALSRNKKQYVPDFLREGMGIPLPGGTEDQQSYLRQSGLPIEDLNKLMAIRNGLPDWKRTAEKNVASVAPGILAPLELLLTGKQSYTNRKLSELDAPITGIPGMDTAIHYSPFSGLTGDVLNVLDPRKTVGQKVSSLTTGGKVGTYNPSKMKLNELRKKLSERAAESPYVRTFEKPYIPERFRDAAKGGQAEADLTLAQKLARLAARIQKKMDAQPK